MAEPHAPQPAQEPPAPQEHPAPVGAPEAALPRIWPALTVAAAALPAAIVVQSAALVAGLAATGSLDLATDPVALVEWLTEFALTPLGFVLILVVPQATYLAMAFVPAMLSRAGLARRLGFVRGTLPWWGYPVLIVATPVTSFAALLILAPFTEEASEQIQMLNDMFVGAQGATAVALVVFLSVGPGIAEESLFRGYILRRLLDRWPPVLAVVFAGVLFAAVHFDPMHAVAVLPLGLWLGVLVWRSGTIWPAVVCHASNNVLGILGARMRGTDLELDMSFTTYDYVTLAVVGVAFIGAVALLVRCKPATGPDTPIS